MDIAAQPLPSDASEQTVEIRAEQGSYVAPVLKVYGSVRSLTLGGGGSLGDGVTMDMAPSDSRLKEKVVQIGTHPMGFGLYLFDYLPARQREFGEGRQFGVIADEVEVVMPAAVTRDSEGFRRVDYAKLGITRH